MDIGNSIRIAEKLMNNICASFDNETDSCCRNTAKGQDCFSNTAEENDTLVIHSSVEILTVYLRLLRNACANCLSSQSVVQL